MNLVEKIKLAHFSDNVQEDVVNGITYLKEDIFYTDYDGLDVISTRKVKIVGDKAYMKMYGWDEETNEPKPKWEEITESPIWEDRVMN